MSKPKSGAPAPAEDTTQAPAAEAAPAAGAEPAAPAATAEAPAAGEEVAAAEQTPPSGDHGDEPAAELEQELTLAQRFRNTPWEAVKEVLAANGDEPIWLRSRSRFLTHPFNSDLRFSPHAPVKVLAGQFDNWIYEQVKAEVLFEQEP